MGGNEREEVTFQVVPRFTLERFMAKLGERTELLKLVVYEDSYSGLGPGVMFHADGSQEKISPRFKKRRDLEIQPADLLKLITDVLEEDHVYTEYDSYVREWV